ncbi:MAG: HAD-superfamily hydrolase, subfamily [Clostridium sp.]|nr:HAD-superfamily hydrolase, subfamily [Clostridium sp.]
MLTNGAQVAVRDELIYKKQIDKSFVKKLVNDLEKLDIQYILQGEIYSYIKEKYKELYSYYDSFSISRKYIKNDYNIDNVDTYKMEMLCKNKESIDYCLSLENEEYDYNHNISSNVFEFYSKKDTKASGIIKVLEHFNIPIKDSYAFGDGKNDIEMLETVGCGIAMGNASEEVKNHAKKVTCEVENDGIALGIERFILR